MSVVETARALEWDSAFWGFPMAEAYLGAPESFDADYRFLQCLRPVDDLAGIEYLTRETVTCGFKIMDVRVTLDQPLRRRLPMSVEEIRFYEETDLDELVRIARESHRITRFYADPGFPNDRCDDLYETWIRNSAAGWADQVLVAGVGPVGYVTVHLDGEGSSSIGLIAVDTQARGRGVGQRLVQGALRWAHTAGAERMTVVTQGRNIAAQRLFQRCGFRTAKTEIWMHFWAG